MNILIVGLGEVGSHLARKLAAQPEHKVSVVDPSRERVDKLTNICDVHAVIGDGSRPTILEKADADRADLLLAVTNDDNANMLCCLFGRRLGAKRTVLRVKDLVPFEMHRRFFRANIGFDVVLSLEELAATQIVKTIRQNPAVEVEAFVQGEVQLRRLRLDGESALVGVAVRDAGIAGGEMVLTAIDRNHEVLIPHGDLRFEAGDQVLVLGFPGAIEKFEKRVGLHPLNLRKVVMFGVSHMVGRVFEKLRRHASITRITAIVPDRDDAGALSETMSGPGVSVLHGDATDLQLLREEVSGYDVFLGLSDVDELNLMTCQLARQVGIERTISLVHKPDYVGLYHQLGVTQAVSPRLLCADAIHSYVQRGSKSTIAEIEAGKAEIVELEVPKGSRLDGKRLADLNFPKGALVGAIARERDDGGKPQILIPNGDTVIRDQDNLVVFTLRKVLDSVEALVLRGRV
ncbi:MAG: Trk system potassium transporter TrkA [Planctomycetes bacterium]|nr:Trk system potassium transporter TrkA [Planctomycetota bacterium]